MDQHGGSCFDLYSVAFKGRREPARAPGQNILRGPSWAAQDFQIYIINYKYQILFLGVIDVLQSLAKSTRINFNTVEHAKFPTKQCQNGTLAITIWSLSEVQLSNALIRHHFFPIRGVAYKSPGPGNFSPLPPPPPLS